TDLAPAVVRMPANVHERLVDDADRTAQSEPRPQVDVLGAVERFVEPADFADELGARHYGGRADRNGSANRLVEHVTVMRRPATAALGRQRHSVLADVHERGVAPAAFGLRAHL